MKDNDSLTIGLIAFAFVFVLGAVVGNCGGACARASAQDGPRISPVLALARLCVNESGTRAYELDDCAAIHATISFRAEHIYRTDYLTALHRYSRSATVNREGRGRPWIAQLFADPRNPRAWERSTVRGSRLASWWEQTLTHALAVYTGEVVASCAPHTWARADVRPADPTAHRIDCGNTANVFWSVPAYARRWGDS